MNRFKKEEVIKYHEIRNGLSESAIKHLDLNESIKAEINELARSIHIEKFSEEYDHMYDDNVDCTRRGKGENPMSKEYIDRVNLKRKSEGVTPLSPAGMSVSDDSFKIAYAEAEAIVLGRT